MNANGEIRLRKDGGLNGLGRVKINRQIGYLSAAATYFTPSSFSPLFSFLPLCLFPTWLLTPPISFERQSSRVLIIEAINYTTPLTRAAWAKFFIPLLPSLIDNKLYLPMKSDVCSLFFFIEILHQSRHFVTLQSQSQLIFYLKPSANKRSLILSLKLFTNF